MRLCVLGLPGRTFDAVLALCRLALPPQAEPLYEVLLDDDAATRDFFAADPSGHLLIASHVPAPELFRWIARSRATAVLVVPDLYVACAHASAFTLNNRGMLACLLSKSLACLVPARKLEDPVMITGKVIKAELDLLARTFQDLGGRPRDETWHTAERAVLTSFYEVTSGAGSEFRRKEELADARQSCQGLLDLVRDGTAAELVWPPSLFFDASVLARPASAAIDLTGPSRCLCYGPYLHLPPDRWEATVGISVSGKLSSTALRVELYRNHPLANFTASLPGSGAFDVRFEFTSTDAALPLEIRLFIDRGEIEGWLQLDGVQLRPV